MTAVNIGNSVVSGETFVGKRVVRREQLQRRTIRADLVLQEETRLLLERRTQIVVELGKHFDVRVMRGDVANREPLAEEALDERGCTPIGQHATYLPLERGRISQSTLHRDVQQLLVRDAAPQEEGQPGGEFEVANP